MKPATIIGAVLIIVAIIGFAMGGISFTHQKKVVDMGPVQVSHKETDTLPISPSSARSLLLQGSAWWSSDLAANSRFPGNRGWIAGQHAAPASKVVN